MNTFEPQVKPSFESKSRPGLIATLALWQFAGTAVLSLVLYVSFDLGVAISAFLGGSVAALTSLYMAGRLLASKQTVLAPQMLMRFYSSVVLKVLFTLVMMVICIVFIKVLIAPFIIAYLIAAVAINLMFLLVPANDIIALEDRDNADHEI